jgi:hypothetical protein
LTSAKKRAKKGLKKLLFGNFGLPRPPIYQENLKLSPTSVVHLCRKGLRMLFGNFVGNLAETTGSRFQLNVTAGSQKRAIAERFQLNVTAGSQKRAIAERFQLNVTAGSQKRAIAERFQLNVTAGSQKRAIANLRKSKGR